MECESVIPCGAVSETLKLFSSHTNRAALVRVSDHCLRRKEAGSLAHCTIPKVREKKATECELDGDASVQSAMFPN
eukprot:1809114-Amphidinium_carterae.1